MPTKPGISRLPSWKFRAAKAIHAQSHANSWKTGKHTHRQSIRRRQIPMGSKATSALNRTSGSASAGSTSARAAGAAVLGAIPGYTDADSARWGEEPPKSTYRSDFERDRARVLHSSALRRLGAK